MPRIYRVMIFIMSLFISPKLIKKVEFATIFKENQYALFILYFLQYFFVDFYRVFFFERFYPILFKHALVVRSHRSSYVGSFFGPANLFVVVCFEYKPFSFKAWSRTIECNVIYNLIFTFVGKNFVNFGLY